MSSLTHQLRRVFLAGAAILATVSIGVATGCAALPTGAPPTPVVVAADLELTGPDSALGMVFQQALQLRVAQLNQQRLLGDRRLELRVSDNRSDPATAAENLAGHAADPAVTAIIAGGCTACVIAAAPAIEMAGVPTVALAAGTAVATPVAQRRFIFQLAPGSADTAELLVDRLGRAEVETFGLVTVEDGGGDAADGARELAEVTAATELSLVVHERLTSADPVAINAAVDRVAGWRPAELAPDPAAPPGANGPDPAGTPDGPDAVVLWTRPAEAVELAVALRAAGWQGRLFLAASAAGGLFLAGQSAAALAGATLVFTETLAIDQVIAASPARTARQLWWRDYVASHRDYDAPASFAADAIDVIVAAVIRSGTVDRALLRDAIVATNLDGLSGPIRFTPQNHSGLQPLALTALVATGDRWRLAG